MDRAAILAARKERKAAAKAAKKDKSARPRRGPSRKGCGVPPAVVDAIDALELGPVLMIRAIILCPKFRGHLIQ